MNSFFSYVYNKDNLDVFMKKIPILLTIFLVYINMVSAQGFGDFYFGGLFSYFNLSMYLDAVLFIGVFALVHFALKRSQLKDNEGTCFVVSFSVSSFVMYGVLSTGFSLENLINSLGLSQGLLSIIFWVIGVAIVFFLIQKFGFVNFIALLVALSGLLLIIFSLTGIIYEQGAGIVIGGILLILSFILRRFIP